LTIEKLQDKINQIQTSKFIHKALIRPPRKSLTQGARKADAEVGGGCWALEPYKISKLLPENQFASDLQFCCKIFNS